MTGSDDFLLMQAGPARLSLDPQRGGVIRMFSWHDKDILRPTPAIAGDDPVDAACFPMAPFANRVAHGRFTFAGQTVRLARNWSHDPHPIHGKGWRVPWVVVAASQSRAVVRFEGGADEWPWRYRCEQCFRLLDDGLSVELSVENLSDSSMPAMLGLHPYFPDSPGAQLQAQLSRVWLTDPAALPVQQVPTPAAWRFDSPRAINTVPLDHSFCGWSGTAVLRWPDRFVTIRALHCDCLHLYVPAGKDFFCIEPQTAAAGALNRDAGDLTVVAPGQRFAIRVNFEIGGS